MKRPRFFPTVYAKQITNDMWRFTEKNGKKTHHHHFIGEKWISLPVTYLEKELTNYLDEMRKNLNALIKLWVTYQHTGLLNSPLFHNLERNWKIAFIRICMPHHFNCSNYGVLYQDKKLYLLTKLANEQIFIPHLLLSSMQKL